MTERIEDLWILAPVKPRQQIEHVALINRTSGPAVKSRVKIRIWRRPGRGELAPTDQFFIVEAFRLKPPSGTSDAERERLLAALPVIEHRSAGQRRVA
jgi:hypothetical protein